MGCPARLVAEGKLKRVFFDAAKQAFRPDNLAQSTWHSIQFNSRFTVG
jgi:hypothetical protein